MLAPYNSTLEGIAPADLLGKLQRLARRPAAHCSENTSGESYYWYRRKVLQLANPIGRGSFKAPAGNLLVKI